MRNIIILFAALFLIHPVFALDQAEWQPSQGFAFEVQSESTLEDLSLYLYGTPSKAKDIARWNKLSASSYVKSGHLLVLKERPTFPFAAGKTKVSSPKNLFLTPYTGFTYLAYQETLQRKYSAFNHVLQLNAKYNIHAIHAEINAGALLHTAALTKSHSNITGRLFDMCFHAAYYFPFVKQPWKLGLAAGIYYSSLYVSRGSFGYENVYYPELFPKAFYKISATDSLSVFFKYLALTTSVKGFKVTGRKLSLAAEWSHRLANRHPILTQFEWSQNYARIKDINASLRLQTFGVNIGYGF